ncbi:MAG: L-seryl-tRNA(Sec) selenium transferase [Deltaproteobacteria bacterium]|nr:L-seryl-tRNA(Sec) selenium transferase [Deltaproteobacteria bacterium]
MKKDILRELPSVEKVLSSLSSSYSATVGRGVLTAAVREALEHLRAGVLSGLVTDVSDAVIGALVKERVERLSSDTLRRVINASGTVLHTNLGRAILAKEAVEALTIAASGPVDVEFDIGRASRGERDSRIEELLKELTGAEAACAVNNNAAAVLITLNTLAMGREVVISRGELIEIGGSFRLPEVIEKSGCILKEVGTTNRTHKKDFEEAITGSTALLFKAHKSNFDIVGFSSEVGLGELVDIGKRRNIAVVEDLGSGSLVDISAYGLKKEPIVKERVSLGADIVTFSGDKLLGGPQAGLIVGKKKFVDMIRKNPLKRALRLDKLTIAALEATLRLYLSPETLKERLPAFKYLSRSMDDIGKLAIEAAGLIKVKLGASYSITVEDSESQVGSGSLPGHTIPTKVVIVTHPEKNAGAVSALFLGAATPIVGRIHKDRFMLDMRTVDAATDVCPS